MGKGGPPDWMIERGRDRNGGVWRRKHSKERESGVSEWKSAGVWPKQKGVEIAEERKGREMLFIHTQKGCSPHPLQPSSLKPPNTQPERNREPIPSFLI